MFLGGSLGLEAVAGTLVETWGLSRTAPLFILEVTLEEAAEVAGVLLALRAVLADLRVGVGPQGLVVRSVPPAEERRGDGRAHEADADR